MNTNQNWDQSDGSSWQWDPSAPPLGSYPPPKKKPNKATIALGIVAGLLLVGLVGTMLDGGDSDTPEGSSSQEPSQDSDSSSAAATPAEETAEPEADQTPEVEETSEATEEVASAEREPFSGDLTYEETTLILDMVWASYTTSDQQDVCTALLIFGPEDSYAEFAGGFAAEGEGTIDEAAFHDFFAEAC